MLFAGIDNSMHECRPLLLPNAQLVFEANQNINNSTTSYGSINFAQIMKIRREKLVGVVYFFGISADKTNLICVVF